MTKDNGGSAFPSSEVTDHNGDIVTYADPGMSLRDWFAGKAMQAMVANNWPTHSDESRDRLTVSAYCLSDAMLAERAKG